MIDEITMLQLFGFNKREIEVVLQLAAKDEATVGSILRRSLRMFQAVHLGHAKCEMPNDSPGCGVIE